MRNHAEMQKRLKSKINNAILDCGKVEARERLRAAASDAKANPELAKARKPRTPWQWVKGSAAEKEARRALQPNKPA